MVTIFVKQIIALSAIIKMSEEDHYQDPDSDIVDDTEQLLENVYQSTEVTDSEISILQDSEINTEEQRNSEKKSPNEHRVDVIRSTKLPLSRIKNIMRMDPDVHTVNAEAVFLVTKATEMFLETIAKETFAYTVQHKRKTIAKKDLDVTINKVDCLCFLEGAMDF